MKQQQTILIALLLLVISALSGTAAGFSVYGTLRNDTSLGYTNNGWLWNNTLETRFKLQHRSRSWQTHVDARLYYNSGELLTVTNELVFTLNRSFVRFFPEFGHITVGKSYINYGVAGVFNPFEFNKAVKLDDVNYDKEGIAAAEVMIALGDFSGWKVYGGADGKQLAFGSELDLRAGRFRIGAAFHHKRKETNLAGIFFKGDAGVGVHGALALHCNDSFEDPWLEANGGIDYSFGKLILAVDWYCNRRGADNPADYQPASDRDGFLLSRHYLYSTADLQLNEFWKTGWHAFWNLNDSSRLHTVQCSWIPARAVTLTLLINLLPQGGNREFSHEKYGRWSTLLRMECRI